MVSATKQIKHNERGSQRKQNQQIEIDKADAVFVSEVLASIDFKENIARELITQVDTIRDIIQMTDGHNINLQHYLKILVRSLGVLMMLIKVH